MILQTEGWIKINNENKLFDRTFVEIENAYFHNKNPFTDKQRVKITIETIEE